MGSKFAVKTIEQVTRVLIDYRGKTPPKTTEGVKLITAKVIKDGFVLDGDHEYISKETYQVWMRRGYPQKWDILVTTEAPLGEVAQLRSSEEIALAQRVILLRGNPDVIDQQFFFHALKSPFVQAGLKARATGTTVLGIKQSELRRVEIPYFPPFLQRKIAVILSAYDDLIENNTRRIRILEEMVQAIYREWFVNFRFPGHEKVKMVDSLLGKIPEGWIVAPLGNLCIRVTDGSHSSPKSVKMGYPMASVKDMKAWGIEEESCRHIAASDYHKLVRNDCNPLVNDILIAKDGSYLKHAFVVEKKRELVILSSIAILRPNLQQILPHVLCQYLRQPEIRSRLAGYVSGVALPRIILKDFAKFLVVNPEMPLQTQFMMAVEPIVRLIHVLIKNNSTLCRTRNLLIPKLISGDLDVSKLDIKINGNGNG